MDILGISCYYHDSAAAIVRDGVVLAAAEEERFSRRKHDNRFPDGAIDFCLREAGIRPEALDWVVFYEKPLLKFDRILRTTLRTFPRSWRTFGEAMIGWFDENLWVKSTIAERLGLPSGKILFTDHHVAHAASAFFCSPFEEAAILTVDGVGEWTTTALGTGRADWDGSGENRIDLTRELRFPHSLGLLYSVFTAWLGFRVNNGEYKVMGMAPYGQPKYQERVYELLHVEGDGSFWLDMDYFSFHHSPVRAFSRKFVDLFGEPRPSDADFVTRVTHPDGNGRSRAELDRNQYYADVAASIQRVTEDTMLGLVRELHRETGLDRLCMAGGVALNSVANGRIIREGPFTDVYIQPAAGDSGGALGAALHAHHVLLGQPRRYVMEDAYLGESWSDAEVRSFLEREGIKHETFDSEDRLVERLIGDLEAGKVLSLFQGRFEWGPRALGNRSIVADPRTPEMKDIVNTKIKFREPFRPFAPVVPEPAVEGAFGLPRPEEIYPARFMLMVQPWEDGAGRAAPACNHMGTGRLQSIRREWNPRYHDLVEGFGQATGVPVLMNTSFNLRGEPMVASPEDAVKTFHRSGIDVLVLENCVVRK